MGAAKAVLIKPVSRGQLIAFILVGVILLAFLPALTAFAATAHLYIANQSGVVGDEIAVAVQVENPSGLAGGNIVIAFDPQLVQPVEAKSGRAIGSVLFMPNLKYTDDSVNIAWADIKGIDQGGELLVLTFSLKGEGVSPLEIREVNLTTAEAGSIEARTTSGRMTVSGDGAARRPAPDNRPADPAGNNGGDEVGQNGEGGAQNGEADGEAVGEATGDRPVSVGFQPSWLVFLVAGVIAVGCVGYFIYSRRRK